MSSSLTDSTTSATSLPTSRRRFRASYSAAEDDYEQAKKLLADYAVARKAKFTPVSRAEFERRIESKLRPGDSAAKRPYLPEVIEERLTIEDAREMGDWIDLTFTPSEPATTEGT